MTDLVEYRRLFYDKLLVFLLLSIILLPTFAVYSGLADHEFVSLDDSLYVFDNPQVQSGLSLDNVVWAFQTMTAEFWHPLTWLSYMLDTEIYGVGPGGYLLTNLLLHLFNSALIFICFKRCTGRLWESWLIGLVFALHPLHVEPVAWVSGRKELLCACFWLLAVLSYDEYRRRPACWRYFSVMMFFVLGIMAKPMIVTLPFVLLLLDYWPLCRADGRDPAVEAVSRRFRRWRALVMEKIPLFGISAAGIAITLIAQQRGDGLVSTAMLPLWTRIFHALTSYALYLKKSIWPGSLTVFYPVPSSISGARVMTALFVLLAVTAIVVYCARRRRYLFTGWFWFLGTLAPVIGIVKVGEFLIADRYMYMPLAGILIILVFSLKALIDKLPHRLTWMIIIPLLLTAVYAPAMVLQIRTWQNSETLYAHALLVTKENFLAHHALGHVLASRKDKAGAIDHFSKAAAIRPDKAVLWVTLGKALAFDHQWTKAAEAFERAARLKPEHPAVWFYLGCIRAVRGETPEALDFFLQSLEKARHEDRHIDSVHQQVMGLYEKGRYYAARDQLPLADQYYTQALSLVTVSVSRRQLTRLIIDGYDQWLAEITRR